MSEEDVIKKLQTIKVSADKDYIYNFEAGTILNLIKKQQEEIELLKEQQQYVIDEYGETIEKKDKIINELKDKISLIETYYDISDLDRIVKEDM